MQSWSRADQWQRAREKYSLQMEKYCQLTKLVLKIEFLYKRTKYNQKKTSITAERQHGREHICQHNGKNAMQ